MGTGRMGPHWTAVAAMVPVITGELLRPLEITGTGAWVGVGRDHRPVTVTSVL